MNTSQHLNRKGTTHKPPPPRNTDFYGDITDVKQKKNLRKAAKKKDKKALEKAERDAAQQSTAPPAQPQPQQQLPPFSSLPLPPAITTASITSDASVVATDHNDDIIPLLDDDDENSTPLLDDDHDNSTPLLENYDDNSTPQSRDEMEIDAGDQEITEGEHEYRAGNGEAELEDGGEERILETSSRRDKGKLSEEAEEELDGEGMVEVEAEDDAALSSATTNDMGPGPWTNQNKSDWHYDHDLKDVPKSERTMDLEKLDPKSRVYAVCKFLASPAAENKYQDFKRAIEATKPSEKTSLGCIHPDDVETNLAIDRNFPGGSLGIRKFLAVMALPMAERWRGAPTTQACSHTCNVLRDKIRGGRIGNVCINLEHLTLQGTSANACRATHHSGNYGCFCEVPCIGKHVIREAATELDRTGFEPSKKKKLGTQRSRDPRKDLDEVDLNATITAETYALVEKMKECRWAGKLSRKQLSDSFPNEVSKKGILKWSSVLWKHVGDPRLFNAEDWAWLTRFKKG